MAEAGDITVHFRGDSSGVEAAASRVNGALRRVGEVAAGVGLGLTFQDIARQVVQFGANLIRVGDQLSDLSDQTNISVGALAGLRIAADQSGTSIDAVARSSHLLVRNLIEGADGTGRQAEALKRLGISTGELGQYLNNTEGFLERVAQGLGGLKTRAEQASVAQALLGRNAGQLLPVLLQIAKDGLPKVSDAAEAGYKALGRLSDKLVEMTGRFFNFSAEMVRAFELSLKIGEPANAKERTAQLEKQIETLRRYQELSAKGSQRTPFESIEFLNQIDKAALATRGKVGGGRVTADEATKAIEAKLANIRELNRTIAAEGRPPPAGDLSLFGNKDAENRLKSVTESLQKQALAAEAEAKALSIGETEALRWKLTHEAMAELNVSKLSPSLTALIDKIVGFSEKTASARMQAEALRGEFQRMAEEEAKTLDASKAFLAAMQEIGDSALTPMEKQLADINRRFTELENTIIEFGERTGQDVSGELAAARKARGDKLREVQGEKSPTQSLTEGLDRQIKSIEIQEKAFKAAGVSYDASREKLEAYRAVIQGLGPDIDLSNANIQDAIEKFGRLNKELEFVDGVKSIVQSGFDAIGNSIRGFQQGTKKAADVFKDFALTVVSGVAEMTVKLLVIKPLMEQLEGFLKSLSSSGGGGGSGGGGFSLGGLGGLFSGLLGGGGGSSGGLFGFGSAAAGVAGPSFANGGFFSSAGGSILSSITSLFGFAEGGVVPGPMGSPTLAVVHGGEEVLTPAQRGGGTVYNIDARGAQRGVSAEIMAAIEQSKRSAVKESVAEVQNQRRRSSNFAKTFR